MLMKKLLLILIFDQPAHSRFGTARKQWCTLLCGIAKCFDARTRITGALKAKTDQKMIMIARATINFYDI